MDDPGHLGSYAAGELRVIDELAILFHVSPTQRFLLAILQYVHLNRVERAAYQMAVGARLLGTATRPSSMGTVVAWPSAMGKIAKASKT